MQHELSSYTVKRTNVRPVWYTLANSRIIPKISNRFRNEHDKTHLTRADAESGLSDQQENGESPAHGKKSRVQAREAREAVEENKKAQIERDKQLSEQQKQAVLAKEFKAQVKQLIEMNRITVSKGTITFNFTDGNLIKKSTSISKRRPS
jgi:uncharacterized protein YaiL (DUF2058 family)